MQADEFFEIVGGLDMPPAGMSAWDINQISSQLGESQVLLQRFVGRWLMNPSLDINDEAIAILFSLRDLSAELINCMEDYWDEDDEDCN